MNSSSSQSPSRKVALATLKKLMKQRVTDDQTIPEIWGFASGDSEGRDHDRMVILGVTSLLEEALESILNQFFVQITEEERRRLFSDDRGTLATFAARIQMAYAIGLIGTNTKHDLTNIRYVRNACAHVRAQIGFDSPEIQVLCDDLAYPKTDHQLVVMISGVMGSPKSKFVETARARWISLMFPGPGRPSVDVRDPERTPLLD